MIKDIAHIHLNVMDLDRAIRFYTQTLGMTLNEHFPPEWASLQFGNLEIGLLKVEWASPYIQRSTYGSRVGATLTLSSTDLIEDRKCLEAAGTTIIRDEKYYWGDFFLFEDTEGNVLRLMKMKYDPALRPRKFESPPEKK